MSHDKEFPYATVILTKNGVPLYVSRYTLSFKIKNAKQGIVELTIKKKRKKRKPKKSAGEARKQEKEKDA